MASRPVLVFGYGNPGRGDDALGAEFLSTIEAEDLAGVECQGDMQLQIEHVTDLEDRSMVLFVDADMSCAPPFEFSRLHARHDDSYTSHAMSPAALLLAYRKVYGRNAPPAFLLRIRGYDFALGDELGQRAAGNLAAAVHFARPLLQTAANNANLQFNAPVTG